MSRPDRYRIRTAYRGKMSWPRLRQRLFVDLAVVWPAQWLVDLILCAIITLGLGMTALLPSAWHTLEEWL